MIELLEDQYEEHSAAFYDQYDNLTDDDVAALEVSQGFDDLKPYEDFESYFGISSLRSKVEGEISTWLQNPSGSFPEDNYLVKDESEQALLNQSGQVKIGGILYNKLIGVPGDGEEECVNQANDSDWQTPTSNAFFRVRLNIKFSGGKAKAWIRPVYTYAGSAGYYKKATKVNARVYGQRYDQVYDCNFVGDFDSGWRKNSEKRRRKLAAKIKFGGSTTKRFHFTGDYTAKGSPASLTYD